VIECKKIYADTIKPEGFAEKSLEAHYPLGDYHRVYYGEVVSLRGDKALYCG
jgi:hypothetical protein